MKALIESVESNEEENIGPITLTEKTCCALKVSLFTNLFFYYPFKFQIDIL